MSDFSDYGSEADYQESHADYDPRPACSCGEPMDAADASTGLCAECRRKDVQADQPQEHDQ